MKINIDMEAWELATVIKGLTISAQPEEKKPEGVKPILSDKTREEMKKAIANAFKVPDRLMQLTRDEAIANHRKMWNWIADETERLERVISKSEYFEKHNISHNEVPRLSCYCCGFDLHCWSLPLCGACPINWGVNTEMYACLNEKSPYKKWNIVVKRYSDDWKSAAKLARFIANLPERKE